jgi:DNA polymerase-4
LSDFSLHTRARSMAQAVVDRAEFSNLAHAILDEVLPLALPVRLMGLTLSALAGDEPEPVASEGEGAGQLALF